MLMEIEGTTLFCDPASLSFFKNVNAHLQKVSNVVLTRKSDGKVFKVNDFIKRESPGTLRKVQTETGVDTGSDPIAKLRVELERLEARGREIDADLDYQNLHKKKAAEKLHIKMREIHSRPHLSGIGRR